jgi:hypothetical protein
MQTGECGPQVAVRALRSSASASDDDRIASFHEAGHAIAAWAQGVSVYHVSIMHEDGAGGQTALCQEPNLLHSVPSMERMARISLAGPIVQRRACLDREIDQRRAGVDMIVVRALFFTITGGNIGGFTDFIARLSAETEVLVFAPMNWARVLAVADALMKRRKLTGRELGDVIKAVRKGIKPPRPVTHEPLTPRCVRGAIL